MPATNNGSRGIPRYECSGANNGSYGAPHNDATEHYRKTPQQQSENGKAPEHSGGLERALGSDEQADRRPQQ